MGSKHRPDWTLVSYAEADHEIWQNRYGQLATKTKAGTWKPITLYDACDEIMLGARIKTAIMLLGLTMREAANKVGCTQPQLVATTESDTTRTWSILTMSIADTNTQCVRIELKATHPLSWQHRSEQARIDQLIEQEERDKNAESEPCRYEDTADYVLEQFSRFLDGEPSDFD